VQADEDFVWCSTPDMPKVDGSFSTLVEPHDGQLTDAARANISFSKRVRQRLQRNSNIGNASASRSEWYLNDQAVWPWGRPQSVSGCAAPPDARRE